MKLLACFLLLLTTSLGLAAQEPPTRARDELKGPVRTIESGTIDFVLKDGKRIEGTPRVAKILKFDERGNRTEATTFDPDGGIAERMVYKYDALGRNTGSDEYYSLARKLVTNPRRRIYTLDHNGKVVEMIVYEADGSVGSGFKYKYDSKGNKVEDHFISWTGATILRTTYTYDAAGHLLTQTAYDAHDVVSWKTIDSYDSAGRRTDWAQYEKHVLRYRKLFKYDDKGRVTEEETFEFNARPRVIFSHAPVPGKIVSTYDDKQRSKEIATYDTIGALKTREVHIFDEHGNIVGWEIFNADGSARNFEISLYDKNKLVEKLAGKALNQNSYDSQGNWTKKVYLILPEGAKEPQPWRADYRNITYY